MPLRRITRLGQMTPEARKAKLKRKKIKEEMLKKHIKSKITNETNKNKQTIKLKLKKVIFIKDNKETTRKTAIKKNNANNDGLENWQEDFAMRLGTAGSGDNLQPIVKQEPIHETEVEECENKNLEDVIELSKEVKVEYDCVTNEGAISSIKPILVKEQKNEIEKPNDGQVEFSPTSSSSLQTLTSGTKFSKMTPIKTKDEALRFIRLLESFALYKENFRLIGFIERLQNHFEKS